MGHIMSFASNPEPVCLLPVGHVASPLTGREDAPRQGDEGAPEAEIVVGPGFAPALAGIIRGDRLVVITWLNLADRKVLTLHPRGDSEREKAGVFATRSPDRPNPLGLHDVTVTHLAGGVLTVAGLEAVDGTPVLDIKPHLGPVADR